MGLSPLKCNGNSSGWLGHPRKTNPDIWRCPEILSGLRKKMDVARGPRDLATKPGRRAYTATPQTGQAEEGKSETEDFPLS